MTKASDNAFPSILITEGTEPSAPAAGKQRLYIDSTTHLVKVTNSSGTDSNVGAGATTTLITTDTAWAAKGNLIAGTANDTAAILSVGSNAQVLTADSTQTTGLIWATPSAGSGGLLAITAYDPSLTDTTISGTSLADVDATHLVVTFTTPASGNILVRLTCSTYLSGTTAELYWGLREASSDVAGPRLAHAANTHDGGWVPRCVPIYMTGVSAGAHTYKWSAKRVTANANMRYGGAYGMAVMEVWAAP